MTDAEKVFAKYMFHCVDISNYMPDFLAQTKESIQQGMLDFVFRFANGGNMPFHVPGLAERLGAPLIEVLYTAMYTYELRFVHLSIYQYLADSWRFAKNSKIPEMIQTRKARGLFRGAVAVWYLTECLESRWYLEVLCSDDPGPNLHQWSECYFPMAYCLWDALKVQEPNLKTPSRPLLDEVESTLTTLTSFLSSRRCLRWFELSTIINFTGNFWQLLDRILEALKIAQVEHSNSAGSWACIHFSRARLSFPSEWKSIVLRTTPWAISSGKSYIFFEATERRPVFFDGGPGQAMMGVGQSWSAKLMMFSTARGVPQRVQRLDIYAPDVWL